MKKCDVLYIHSTKNPLGANKFKYAVMPMGIIGILNNLRSQGIEVLGINYAIEKTLDPDFDLKTALADIDYKILLTDLHWYEHSFGALYVVENSKKVHPQVPTVIGGYSATIFANEIMENFGLVDYIVTGDSDLPMDLLVNGLLGKNDISLSQIPNILYRCNSKVMTSEKTWVQTDLDGINFVDIDFFEHSDKVPFVTTGGLTGKSGERWICIARGCTYNCAYCCGARENMETLFRRCNVITRSPEKVADDFLKLEKAGICRVSPSHDFQMFGQKYYKEVFAAIRKRSIKPGLYLECFQLPTKDFIDEIINTFDKRRTVLAISPISGNEELRRQNGKIFNNEDFYETIKYILDNKIPLQLYYTLNIVGETYKQFEDTYTQMFLLRHMFNFQRKNVFYQRVVIDPLAPMRKFEEIKTEYNTFMDYYNYCQSEAPAHTITGFEDGSEVSAEEKIEKYQVLFK